MNTEQRAWSRRGPLHKAKVPRLKKIIKSTNKVSTIQRRRHGVPSIGHSVRDSRLKTPDLRLLYSVDIGKSLPLEKVLGYWE